MSLDSHASSQLECFKAWGHLLAACAKEEYPVSHRVHANMPIRRLNSCEKALKGQDVTDLFSQAPDFADSRFDLSSNSAERDGRRLGSRTSKHQQLALNLLFRLPQPKRQTGYNLM